jgi:GNAT superfamily N-acetyltransferase
MSSATSPPVRLKDLPEDQIRPLLLASEAEGFRFVRRVVREWNAGINTFSGGGDALLGTYVSGQLVGICGLMVDPYTMDPAVGRLRNLYVLPEYRGQGIGASLTRSVIALAAPAYQSLRLRAGTPQAAKFYERLGFTPTPGVPDCTHVYSFERSNLSGNPA